MAQGSETFIEDEFEALTRRFESLKRSNQDVKPAPSNQPSYIQEFANYKTELHIAAAAEQNIVDHLQQLVEFYKRLDTQPIQGPEIAELKDLTKQLFHHFVNPHDPAHRACILEFDPQLPELAEFVLVPETPPNDPANAFAFNRRYKQLFQPRTPGMIW